MKIKYIGNFTDGTGWAKASTYNALSLDAAGFDVYCAELKYNNENVVHEERILDLLSKQSDTCDITIQHVLPTEYKRYPNTKNVGFFVKETLTLTNALWLKKLGMMDLILTPKEWGHTFNYDKVISSNADIDIPDLRNTFNFCFCGEFVKRKNLELLIAAFHSEFEYIEPVNLYIKTGGDLQNVLSFCEGVRQRTRKLGRYKKELIITDRLPDDMLWTTMRKCHAFVMPSYGEAWCYPMMEAAALGLRPIYTGGTDMDIYLRTDGSLPIAASPVQCYGAIDGVEGLYTSNDLWMEPNLQSLRQQLRRAFIEWNGAPPQPNERYRYYDYRNTAKTLGEVNESLYRLAGN